MVFNLEKVRGVFQALKDENGKSLYNDNSVKIVDNAIGHAGKGCYSDNSQTLMYLSRFSTRSTSQNENFHLVIDKDLNCYGALDVSRAIYYTAHSVHKYNARRLRLVQGDPDHGHFDDASSKLKSYMLKQE